MRYVAISLAVLLLAVAVGGQDIATPGREEPRLPSEPAAERFGPLPHVPLADSNPATPGLPPVMPLKEGQAAKLRDAVRFTNSALPDLRAAAKLFAEGGAEPAAQRILKVAEEVEQIENVVRAGLDHRETTISQRISELEAELARLKEALRVTQEGAPPDRIDPPKPIAP